MALAKAGCAVTAVCPFPHPLGKTRVAEQIHTYNGLVPLRSFTEAITATKPDFIVPCDDLAVRHLHQLYQKSRRHGKAGESICVLIENSLGAPEDLPTMYARAAFMELAATEGIRVPKTTVVANADELETCIARMGLPMVLKANGTSGGLGVRVVHSIEEAEQALRVLQAPPFLARAAKRAVVDRDFTLLRPFLLRHRSVVNAQAFVAGREATSAIACWKGAVLASLHFEVLNKAEAVGHATVLRLIENTEMSAATQTIARRLNLSGVHGFDFMLEAGTGNAYLIEMNPRATQVGHLTLGPGRDIPAALYSALSGETVQPAPKLTDKDTVVLFPHEWLRNPSSVFLLSGHHDVPWEEPELVRACVKRLRKPNAWYSQPTWIQTLSAVRFLTPRTTYTGRSTRPRLRSGVSPEISSEHASGSQPNETGFGVPVPCRTARPPNGKAIELIPEHFIQDRLVRREIHRNARKPLRVMKFGGTSVEDPSCIEKVVDIIRTASRESSVVVVVSAMRGVTNSLIEAARQSAAGNHRTVATIFEELRKQHDTAVSALIRSAAERSRISDKLQEIFQEGDRLCQGTCLLGELTPRAHDSISSLGERLSTPLVAAALSECGMASEAIEATELIVTDSQHGAADPWMDPTCERCEARLRPLLQQGIVPVVTGFIGATAEGVLTTLGRGGSDYSATILAAALGADEVTIWKDVDGLMTADPRLVPGACTIPEISYREAAELANCGAKVLHPKTLSPVVQCGIPLWIRNTFAPERRGTKITPTGSPNGGGMKALTGISEAALVSIFGRGIGTLQALLGRALAATAAFRANVLLISPFSSQNDICLAVPSSLAHQICDALHREFELDLAAEKVARISLDSSVAIVTVVGQNMRDISAVVGRAFSALSRENVNIIASVQGSSECNISFAVAQKDMKAALVALHREFQLGTLNSQVLSLPSPGERPATWLYKSEASAESA